MSIILQIKNVYGFYAQHQLDVMYTNVWINVLFAGLLGNDGQADKIDAL
jgi:hypothetical protein